MSTLIGDPGCNPKCSACHYKGFSYSEQLERKNRWAESQLGRWKSALRPVVASPEAERIAYRSKSWLRSSFQDGTLAFGMYRSIQVSRGGKWEKEFIDWTSCPLHARGIQKMLPFICENFTESFKDFSEKSLVGVWFGSPHVVVISRNTDEEQSDLEDLRSLDWTRILTAPFNQVWFHCNTQVGRKIFGHREIRKVAGESRDSVQPIRAFRQVAQTLLTQARASAVEALLQHRPDAVVDLYCGTGELASLLPSQTGWLGIELSSAAAEYAQSVRPTGCSKHLAFVGTVEHRLRDPRFRKELGAIGSYSLYVNPPRSGLGSEARGAILENTDPEAIVYLSCSASSLARDLSELEKGGFQIESLKPYDFFPQTEHFETLAVLRRSHD